jgi:hypothetical protein
MKALRLKISDKWSSLKWYERDYFVICLFLYLVMIVTEVLHYLHIFGKLINVISLIMGLFLVLYLYSLPFWAKKLKIKLPFAQVLESESDWKSFKGLFAWPLLYLTIISNLNRNLLDWAPFWLKITIMLLILLLLIYSLMFPSEEYRISNTQESRTIDTNQTINVLATVFVIILMFIGFLVYYDLQK